MADTKAFSQTSIVIEGNQKDSSLSRGGGDDVLHFQRLLRWVYIASPETGRGKSKAFPGRLTEHPHGLVGAAGEAGGTQQAVFVADCHQPG